MDIIIKCLAFIGAVSVLGSMVLVVFALRVMKGPHLDSGKKYRNIALDMALVQEDRPMFTDSKIEIYKPANTT
jgi:hypothetical protein